jgi:cytochrome c
MKIERVPCRAGAAGRRGAAQAAAVFLWVPALAACQSTPAEQVSWDNPATGLLVARESCGGCHQAGRTGESPNPDAPPFADIAGRPGLTAEALAAWLRDGHNYPVEMGFRLEPHQVDALVAYMVRLRSGDGPS